MAKNSTQSADVPEPVFDRGPSGVGETTWQNTDKGVPFVDPSADYGINRRRVACLRMTEGFDSDGADAASPDGSPASKVTPGEVAWLTSYADAQQRKVRELEKTVDDIRYALEARIAIDRAIGMLSERFDLTIADAFEVLRAAARDNRKRVERLRSR